jgi:hypothetical protein
LITQFSSSSGVTLVEVLAAIFVMAIGLLSLLALFPLGALSMAQAIKDDRAATIAARADAFSKAGEDVLLRTQEFAQESLLKGSVDLDIAAQLDQKYEQLALDATYIELQLEDLQSSLPPPQVQRYTAPLLADIRLIQRRIRLVRKMLSLLNQANPGS